MDYPSRKITKSNSLERFAILYSSKLLDQEKSIFPTMVANGVEDARLKHSRCSQKCIKSWNS